MWPFNRDKTEDRQIDYGDSITAAIMAQAVGVANAEHTLALEASAGHVGRAFAAAHIDGGMGAMLEPHLEHIGRSFIRSGESLLVPNRVRFERPASFYVYGDEDWKYEVTLPRPESTETKKHDAKDVLHFRVAESNSQPWKGRGPLQVGGTGAKLIARLESSLATEAKKRVGALIPVPVNPTDAEFDAVKSDFNAMHGNNLFVESMRTGWGDADQRGVSSRGDWEPNAVGPRPDANMVTLLVEHRRAVLAACGVPPEILGGAEGAGRREAFRQFVYGTLLPLGIIVEREVRHKYGETIRISWDRLRAGDVAGRARAYNSLTGEAGAMDPAKAEALVGFGD